MGIVSARPSSSNEDGADETGAEMSSARSFTKPGNGSNPPRQLLTLWEECRKLRRNYQLLSEAIDEIFDDDESEESTKDLENRLQDMTRISQKLIEGLTFDLERHAKLVCAAPEANERLMVLVKELVSVVNAYMTMLIRNIRKLKRLIADLELDGQNQAQANRVQSKSHIGYLANNNIKVPRIHVAHRPAHLEVYDVISDTQDVDAMLVQLQATQTQREELERDIVTVLACWRDFNTVVNDGEEAAPEVVIAAADSVAAGLAHINR